MKTPDLEKYWDIAEKALGGMFECSNCAPNFENVVADVSRAIHKEVRLALEQERARCAKIAEDRSWLSNMLRKDALLEHTIIENLQLDIAAKIRKYN